MLSPLWPRTLRITQPRLAPFIFRPSLDPEFKPFRRLRPCCEELMAMKGES
jgi:hypothetical protein